MEIYDFKDYYNALDKGSYYHNIRNTPWYRENVYPRVSEAEFDRRHQRLRETMAENEYDCLIVCGGQSTWSQGAGVSWLSGLIDKRSMAQYIVFPLKGEPLLVYAMGGAHAELARRMTSHHEVQPALRGRFAEIVVERIQELGLAAGRIGVLPCISGLEPEFLPEAQMAVLRQALPEASLELAPDLFHAVAWQKSPEEISAFARAGQLAVAALQATRARAVPGAREQELAAAAVQSILAAGGQPHFIRVGSTPGAAPALSMANPLPSRRALSAGDMVLVEVGAGLQSVTAQLGHAFSIGEPAEGVARFWDTVVVPGFKEMEATLGPGSPLEAIQKAGRSFRRQGYQSAPLLLHGLDIEASGPWVFMEEIVAEPFERTLQPGMVVVLRPNPIQANGEWGMVLSRTYALGEDSCIPLTKYPLELDVVEAGN